MGQSKLSSLIEATLNMATGFIISMFLAWAVWPLFGYAVTLSQSFWVTCIFTITSVLRSYLWRRYFNKRLLRALDRNT